MPALLRGLRSGVTWERTQQYRLVTPHRVRIVAGASSTITENPPAPTPAVKPKLQPINYGDVEASREGDAYFSSPWPQTHDGQYMETRPLMFYLPGIDGTGMAANRQFPLLAEEFVLSCLTMPPSSRQSFDELLTSCVDHITGIAATIPPSRPIYLLGESFGGVLALSIAATAPGVVDRIVLVNPATSFPESVWSSAGPLLEALPPPVYAALPFLIAPVLSNPLTMAAHNAILQSTPMAQAASLVDGLQELLPSLPKLAEVLPQDTLLFRLQLLAQGCAYIDSRYYKVESRVLCIASTLDLLIPSEAEATELQRRLPHCRTALLPYRSHAVLMEAGINLPRIMRDEGFLVSKRRLTGDGPLRSKRGGGVGVIGKPMPVELPTAEEFEIDRSQLDNFKTLCSPVFFSTQADGTILQGLSALGIEPGRPMLLVGNHQTLPVDIGVLVEGVYAETGVLMRGLTHPVAAGAVGAPKPRERDTPSPFPSSLADALARATGQPSNAGNEFISKGNEEQTDARSNELGTGGNAGFMRRWGAVRVGAKALFSLLRSGESVLLFPGGGVEALKGSRTIDKYALIWPDKPEFVRAAARFGATIVPFGAIGCDESATAVMNPENFKRLTNAVTRLQGKEPAPSAKVSARRGVSLEASFEDDLALRMYVPRRVERYYFLFGRPIQTSKGICDDRQQAERVYQKTKKGVESCITYLLEAREKDKYGTLAKRLAYERQMGSPAPTFDPQHPELLREAQKLGL